ncbi:hypothetical protein HYH03_004098 [Edaphochlamys debaryana]|uniref:JmjC domain-containing protein n=1 Tax=Edaphochlamys debaryana TaxID=47281 RepID=A0A835YAP8_9CHLO|nr:hypothetical protein HYH03_004098 [Edaphochlamys debaryana]|eukprot:KAG2497828.1 hypothetical protein HYH03_004098 [Edaphochlamys debaryana]
MTPAQFVQQYDSTCMPVLLCDMLGSWPVASWELPALSAAFPAARFKVSKPHGGRALMTLPAYVDYMARQADEEPLYIFDPDFAEAAPGIRQMYDVPHVFAEDYMDCLRGVRPPYRWLVLGPARAGASWHVDPSLTSAWNSLLSGRKRWALYPPHRPPPGLVLDEGGQEDESSSFTSLQWFLEVYPTLPPEQRPVEFVQNPGETVFVPGGWWHAVLNLETSVAVTQNYVGASNLERVVRYMAASPVEYHSDPLSFFKEAEVEAWSLGYPVQMAAAAELCSGGSSGDWEEAGSSSAGGDSSSGAAGEATEEECVVRALHAMRLDDDSGDEVAGPERKGQLDSLFRNLAAGAQGVAAGSGPASEKRKDAVEAAANGDGREEGTTEVTEGQEEGASWDEVEGPEAQAVWRRHRYLGRWLRRLWDLQPSTRPSIEKCLGQCLHAASWRSVLATIAEQCNGTLQPSATPNGAPNGTSNGHSHGAPNGTCAIDSTGGGSSWSLPAQPSPLELVPLVGSDAMVFIAGGMAVKLFVHEAPAMRGLECALEVAVPRLLLRADAAAEAPASSAADRTPPLRSCLPAPVAAGAVAVRFPDPPDSDDEDEEEGERKVQEKALKAAGKGKGAAVPAEAEREAPAVPYVVQRQLQGAYVVQELWPALAPEQRLAVAQALGHLVGRMHAAAATLHHTPACASSSSSSSSSSAAAGSSNGHGQAHGAEVRAGPLAAPPPADAADYRHWAALVGHCGVWHDREGHIWMSGVGSVGASEAKDGEDMAKAAAAVAAVPNARPGAAAAAAAAAATHDALCDVPKDSRWWPFAQFLRWRQRSCLGELGFSEPPEWLRLALPGFLPADPACLLGFAPPPSHPSSIATAVAAAGVKSEAEGAGASGGGAGPARACSGPRVGPLLLHGDVSSSNVMLELPGEWAWASELPTDAPHSDGAAASTLAAAATAQAGSASPLPLLRLIDFSDSGHGDPLQELVAIQASCLVCDGAAMRAFWAAYRTHVDPARVWPYRHGVRLSYVAMCYCLVHEEAELLLRKALEQGQAEGLRTECGAQVAGKGKDKGTTPTLEELQERLWGFLDEP